MKDIYIRMNFASSFEFFAETQFVRRFRIESAEY